jgi:hypothetical protein
LESAYLTGDFAIGQDSKIIDIVFIGQNLDDANINQLVVKTQKTIKRKIRHLVLTRDQMSQCFQNKGVLLIWKKEKATENFVFQNS